MDYTVIMRRDLATDSDGIKQTFFNNVNQDFFLRDSSIKLRASGKF